MGAWMGHADFRPVAQALLSLHNFWAALLNRKEWKMWVYEYVEWVK